MDFFGFYRLCFGFLDFFGVFEMFRFFLLLLQILDVFWSLWILFKVTKGTTKRYGVYYQEPKVALNKHTQR